MMDSFDAAFTVDSVVACRCCDFSFKAIFYPQYLNEIAVELAQCLRKVLLGSVEQLCTLLDLLLGFLLQGKYLLLFRIDP
jgi:hypothetical protein